MTKNLFENLKIKELETLVSLASNPKKFILRRRDFYKHLKFGDIICSLNFLNRKGLFAKSIMRMTKSRISHAVIYVGHGKKLENTSHKGFVNYQNLDDMKGQVLIVLRTNLSSAQKKKLHSVVDRMLKERPKYNVRGIAGHAVYKITGFFPSWLNEKDAFFCSEFVYECYLQAGCKLGEHENSTFVSPTDILESPKLHIVCLLDGINGIKFSRKTRDSDNQIQEDAKKIILRKVK